ncbi:hypothetical protein EJ02DRAFT_425758 [Clathrospora elynae]|uniref:Uncharacterized protein n=1 Tax=Clathrospora elynae TaxID=706981 RepID=A0A6A5SIQ7_9PLEO|nr:hypothetical protein EJ02DRAFT_425758 [Clathrospora elynae]
MAATSATVSSRSFSWTDDEQDDWNFETWKATADTSAPTLADLGPLQLPPAEDDEGVAYTSSRCKNTRSLFLAVPQHPELRGVPFERQVKLAQTTIFTRAIGHGEGKLYSDPSAYPELSSEPTNRKYYTQAYNLFKANSDKDCRRPILYQCSVLRVSTTNDDEVDDKEAEARDEGYVSSSPLVSPDLGGFDESTTEVHDSASDFDFTHMRLGASSHRRKIDERTHSMDTLKGFRESVENTIAVENAIDEDRDEGKVGTANDGSLEATDLASNSVLPKPPQDEEAEQYDIGTERGILTPTYNFVLRPKVTTDDVATTTSNGAQTLLDRTLLIPKSSPTSQVTFTHEIGTINYEPQETTDLPAISTADAPHASAGNKAADTHTNAEPKTSRYLTKNISNGWFHQSLTPRITVGIVVVGLTVGMLVKFARRR